VTTGAEPDLEVVGPALRGTQAPDIRPARPDELVVCAAIWRDAVNDYIVRLGQPAMPDDLGPITTLYRHTQATDPERFVVAVRGDGEARQSERIVAFGSAVIRERTWFLSMLFVLPEEQGIGLGRTVLEHLLPDPSDAAVLATATDSMQPISNGLYSQYGLVPRMPLLHLTGSPTRPDTLPDLPTGIEAVPFDALEAGEVAADASRILPAAVGELDHALLGYAHPADHEFLRSSGRRGYLYRSNGGEALGYGYASEVGRVGPIAIRDEMLLSPVLGHLLRAVQPRGAHAVWVPGAAGSAVGTLLEAGLRIDGAPILLCWSRPFADFSRYLPSSPGLL
jgi:GNAT superfamily N-acetyltransferase